ncbi:Magnesium and cobalt transport protein CorA [hydrothermal vent metagenome]|uniref:Magnesium and cobalt transport protein CorA n=1 Tax=hydrothermal vent metagenome TaxID=652676 RepID=A0A1W1BAB7_9ZZZZ
MIKDLINSLHLEDIQSEEHPSDFIVGDNYTILVLRLPEMQESELKRVSYAFLVYEEQCYLYERESEKFKKLGSLKDVAKILDTKIDKLLKIIKDYHYKIEQLEEELYSDIFDTHFMQKWLSYKKSISLIHRLMFHAFISFELFLSHHKRKKSNAFEEIVYTDILEHINRIKDMSQDIVGRLDNLYDFYRAKVDEKMNKNVYYLTMLSGVFLPLTLITGFFGMNTGGLLWVDDPNGTLKAVALSFVLEFIFFLPFYLFSKKRG